MARQFLSKRLFRLYWPEQRHFHGSIIPQKQLLMINLLNDFASTIPNYFLDKLVTTLTNWY